MSDFVRSLLAELSPNVALLRARNDVAIPTGLTVLSYWGVALGAMLLLARAGHGAQGAWLSLLIGASVCSAGLGTYLWRARGAALGLM